MEEIKTRGEHLHEHNEQPKIKMHGVSIKPTVFAVGGKVLESDGFAGVTAETIQKRLKKMNVAIPIAQARKIHEAINGKPKTEKKGGAQ